MYVLGGNGDSGGTAYKNPPTWELGGHRRADLVNGTVGPARGGGLLPHPGLGPTDVDVCEFYDPFSFEIIRQYEAFGFCGEGEGGDFVTSGAIEPGGQYPVTTDGGVMSYSHAGASAQMLQRVIRGVEQLRGECESNQVEGAEVAMCSNGGSGALFTDVMLLGVERHEDHEPAATADRQGPGPAPRNAHAALLGRVRARHELLFQRCGDCGYATHTPAYLC